MNSIGKSSTIVAGESPCCSAITYVNGFKVLPAERAAKAPLTCPSRGAQKSGEPIKARTPPVRLSSTTTAASRTRCDSS